MKPPSTGQRRHILVVEDNPLASRQFTAVLVGHGYDVVAVQDGQQALDFLAANPAPDLILLDLVMPVLDGWQFLQLLPHPQVPVIVATSTTPPEPEGCAGFLQKPVENEELLAEVRRCLG
jgi:CheY-like chemotaxis protein